MSILERVISLFAPHTCLACGREDDRLLCADCARRLPLAPSQCYRCATPTDAHAVCAACSTETPLHRVLARTHHRGPARDLVHHLKFERAQAAAPEAAALMLPLLARLSSDVMITHVPTATGRARARGYDHARLIARSLARQAHLPYTRLLGRLGQARQVGAGRVARRQQLQHAFRPLNPAAIRGRHIVLVDDVMTTGASLEAAARALRSAGAARVSAVVFARA